jgi:hypothetical protein
MKRLSDLPAEDYVMARTQTLIRAMGPTLGSEERRHRVRRLLDARLALWRWAYPNGGDRELAKLALATSKQ